MTARLRFAEPLLKGRRGLRSVRFVGRRYTQVLDVTERSLGSIARLHTRLLMSLSAVFLAALGVLITFLPQELLTHVGAPAEGALVQLMQLLGALCLGLAALNWMSRGSHLGGIYGRPVSMANFFSFAIGAVALVKSAAGQQFTVEITAMAAVYSLFAIWFGLVLFTHPTREPSK